MKALPKEVIKAAEGRSDLGGSLVRLCKYKGEDIYTYEYNEEMTIGYPELYQWNGKRVKTIYGEPALKLLSELP